MLVALRRDGLIPAITGLQIALLATAPLLDHRSAALALALQAALALFGWWRAMTRGRLIADTPTSRIASAAQGYTELRGRGRQFSGLPLYSPLFGLPVLWYRMRSERRLDERWQHVHTYESDASFLLDDGSGECAVDPEGAEMLITRKDVMNRGDERLTQWSLIPGDPVYVIGEFSTLGSVAPDFDVAEQVKSLLAEWKRDKPQLLARFDLDHSGEIDLEQWALARAAARREVERLRDEMLAAPEAHVVRRPTEQGLYLISDLDPQRLARHHRWISLAQLALFLGGVGAAAALGFG